jgi:beta-carotene 15,15'-dioxygenase
MTQIRKISILASFLGLWITSNFSESHQIIVGFFLIFTFGIVHGANDLMLIKKVDTNYANKTYLQLLASYLFVIIFGTALFSFFPGLALLLFVVISCYHFGEQHWEKIVFSGSNRLKFLFITLYGILIFLLLFEFHSQQVKTIIFSISNYSLDAVNFGEIIFYVSLFILGLGCYFWNKSEDFKNNLFIEIGLLFILAVIFKVGSLIWSFALYFIFWHSIPSLYDQISFLFGNVTSKTIKQYLKSAFIYWFISIVGFVALLYLFKDYAIFDAVFFSFLAAITFPHVFVIKKMYQLK